MSIKQELFTNIRTFRSISDSNLPPELLRFVSTNEKPENDTVFLIEILTLLTGYGSLRELLTKFLDDFIPEFNTKSNKIIKTTIASYDSVNQLADDTVFGISGLTLPIASFDYFGDLKTDELPYESSFKGKFREALDTGVAVELTASMNVQFDQTNEQFIVSLTDATKQVSEIVEEVLDFVTFSKDELIQNLIDSLFNLFKKNKGDDDLINETEADTYLDKLLDQANPTKETISVSSFDFNQIRQNAKLTKSGGYLVYINCQDEIIPINEDALNDLISNVNNEDIVVNVVDELSNIVEDSSQNKGESLKEDLNKKMIFNLLKVLLKKLLFSIEIIFIFNLLESITNTIDKLENTIKDFIDENFDSIKCLLEFLKETFNDYIFDILEEKITELLRKVLQKLLKEQGENYLLVMKGLL